MPNCHRIEFDGCQARNLLRRFDAYCARHTSPTQRDKFASPTFTIDEHTPILVEFAPAPGVVRTALPTSPADIAAQSEKAIASAMSTIHAVAQRVTATISSISERPSTVEVDFGLKLTAGAGALVASASTEAGFVVKLTWTHKEPQLAPRN